MNKFVVVTGGQNSNFSGQARVSMLYDTESNTWKMRADLNLARSNHSSVATDKAIFVFGGESPGFLNSIERFPLLKELDENGNAKPIAWELFFIPELEPRTKPLMVVAENSAILILGGSKKTDGVIYDSETRSVTKLVDTGNF